MSITTTQISWSKVGLAVAVVAVAGTGIWAITHNDPAPPQPKARVQNTVQAQPIVPTYATLTPALPTGQKKDNGESQQPGAQQRQGTVKPRGEKSYEQKLWEQHLAAGVGGEEFAQEAATAATPVAGSGTTGYPSGYPGGCALAPTVPVVMQVESAGYTERGGMLNGLIVQPAMGTGMGCVVLPAGTRVTMEFWGEIGDNQMMEIGFPTFVVPRVGAIQPRPISGMPPDKTNSQLPDYLSGWVMTPTLSLDAGDVITLHLRGELHATR